MQEEKMVYTIQEFARILGIGRSLAYELARRGEIPVLELGRRKLIPKTAVEQMLQAAATGNTDNRSPMV